MEVPITQQEVVMEKLYTVGTTSKETNNSNPTRSINLEKKDEYAPWLLVERRRSRKKVGTSSGVLEEMEITQKVKDARDYGAPTRKSSPRAQVANGTTRSNQTNGQLVSAFNARSSQLKLITTTSLKTNLDVQIKSDPKPTQWVAKKHNTLQGPTKPETHIEPKLKHLANKGPILGTQFPSNTSLPSSSTQVAKGGDPPQALPESNPWPPQSPPNGSLPIPSSTPKNSSILGQGPNVSLDGDSPRLDPGLCLTQGS
ncbi:hypothetical protein SLE2022_024480 [Rubroshorea leprosula]